MNDNILNAFMILYNMDGRVMNHSLYCVDGDGGSVYTHDNKKCPRCIVEYYLWIT